MSVQLYESPFPDVGTTWNDTLRVSVVSADKVTVEFLDTELPFTGDVIDMVGSPYGAGVGVAVCVGSGVTVGLGFG